MKTMDFVNLTRFWSIPLRCWRFPRTRCEVARLLQLQVIYFMSCHTGPPPSGDDRLYQPTSQILLQDANSCITFLYTICFFLFGLSKRFPAKFCSFAKLGTFLGNKRKSMCLQQVSSCFAMVGGSRKHHEIS